jgi:hypothetical protein
MATRHHTYEKVLEKVLIYSIGSFEVKYNTKGELF